MGRRLHVTCCLLIFLIAVAVCLTIILEIGVLIMLNLTNNIERSSSMVESLSKEAMAVMDVFKNMSERFIEKDEWLLNGVMSANNISDYPLDWTQLSSGIPLFSTVNSGELTVSEQFGNKSIAATQMTYVLGNNDVSNDFSLDQLKRLNILNEVWKKVNLVKLGYEFNVDITSMFFMLKDTTNSKEILATFPGQDSTVTTFTNYDFYNEAMMDTTAYITIPLREDPFASGMGEVVGY